MAAGAAVRYADSRLGGTLTNVHALTTWEPTGHMVIDENSRRNLEIVRTIGGQRKGSLLDLLDPLADELVGIASERAANDIEMRVRGNERKNAPVIRRHRKVVPGADGLPHFSQPVSASRCAHLDPPRNR